MGIASLGPNVDFFLQLQVRSPSESLQGCKLGRDGSDHLDPRGQGQKLKKREKEIERMTVVYVS